MPFHRDPLVHPARTTTADLLAWIPQASDWLHGLSVNPALPEQVALRLANAAAPDRRTPYTPKDLDTVMAGGTAHSPVELPWGSIVRVPVDTPPGRRRKKPDLLLATAQEMYATRSDPLWQELPTLKGFSRSGLRRFRSHDAAHARLAALEDPSTTGQDLAALLNDPSPTLRWLARRDKRLPWPYLRVLLRTHPADATANPGLPREVMTRLLDILRVAD